MSDEGDSFDYQIQNPPSSVCCFESLSHDLQMRLKLAQRDHEAARQQIDRLHQEIAARDRTIDQLKCECNQLASQKRSADDQISITTTKGRLMKSDLRKQIESNEMLTSEIDNLRSENEQLQSLIERGRAKNKKLKAAAATARVFESRAANTESQNHAQQVRIQQLEMESEDQHRHIDLLERKLQRLREKFESDHDENQVNSLRLVIEKLNNDLRCEGEAKAELLRAKEDLELKFKTTKIALLDQEELKRRANESSRQEVQIQALKQENENLLTELNEAKAKTRGFHQAQTELDQALSENRILKAELADVRLGVEKFERLEAENRTLNDKVNRLIAQQSNREESLRLTTDSARRLPELERVNAALQQKLAEVEKELPSVRSNQELAAREVMQLTGEVQERERREQHLAARYRFYKAKADEFEMRTKVCEARVDELTQEMIRLRERESQKEAALRRTRRGEQHHDIQRAHLSRQLDSERGKVVQLETALHTVRRTSHL
jgi:chromosome segregation ATPase